MPEGIAHLLDRRLRLGQLRCELPLQAILDRRRVGPDGEALPLDAYVFGSEIGRAAACFQHRREELGDERISGVENSRLLAIL